MALFWILYLWLIAALIVRVRIKDKGDLNIIGKILHLPMLAIDVLCEHGPIIARKIITTRKITNDNS